MIVIGISGKIGTGKTTLSKLFISKYNDFYRIAFGDILKLECSKFYGYDNFLNYSEEGKSYVINNFKEITKKVLGFEHSKNEITVREVLQWHGTDYRRKQDNDYWIKKMIESVNRINKNVIIDDVRFKNEANFVKLFDKSILIRLNPYPNWKSGNFSNHKSEIDLDYYKNWDLILNPENDKLVDCIELIENKLKYINIS